MSAAAIPYLLLSQDVGAGAPIPIGWKPVAACRCLILVGLTGVGKTTVLARLSTSMPKHTVLPDRRTLTDHLIFPFIQKEDGLPSEPVTDRRLRFEYTRRYRQWFPGGMAHAVSQVCVSPGAASGLIVFDGLRGENEVRHAAQLMPDARFLMLDAPDAVRIRRLLSRRDSFDITAPVTATVEAAVGESALDALGMPDLAALLKNEEQQQLLRLVNDGAVSVEQLAAKARIVVEERRNYDPSATRAALEECAPARTLIVDAAALSPDDVAYETARWLGA
jgi:hypothetical protein